jgi:hypothetical protein
MDLNFQLFETATLFITVLVVAFMLQVCLQNKPASFVFSIVYEFTRSGCFAVRIIFNRFHFINMFSRRAHQIILKDLCSSYAIS